MVHFQSTEGDLVSGSETLTLTSSNGTNISRIINSGGSVPYQDYWLIGYVPAGTYTVTVTDNLIGEAAGPAGGYIYVEAFYYSPPQN